MDFKSFYLDKLLKKILVKNSNLKEIFNKSDHLSPWQKIMVMMRKLKNLF